VVRCYSERDAAPALRPFVENGVVGTAGKTMSIVAWVGTAEDSERLDLVCLVTLVNLNTGHGEITAHALQDIPIAAIASHNDR
jgi:hypothetical protein